VRRTVFAALLFTAACAPETEAPLAGGVAGPGGEVTVAVTSGGLGVAGMDVVVHDATGRAIDRVVTNELGEVVRLVPPHAMVTVARPGFEAGSRELLTVRDVEAGDRIAIDLSEPSAPSRMPIAVTLPGAFLGSDGASPAFYTISTGCDYVFVHDLTTLDHEITTCGSDRFNVLAHAVGADGEIVAFTVVEGLEAKAGSAVQLGAWRTDFRMIEVRVPALPEGTQVSLGLDPLVSGAIGAWSPGPFPAMLRVPNIAGDLLVSLTMFSGDRSGAQLQRVVASAPVIEVGELLPAVRDVTLDATVAARPSLAFTIGGDVKSADGVCAAIYWNTESARNRWMLFGRPQEGRVEIPELPEELADYRPGEVTLGGINLFDRDSITQYSALREDPSEVLSSSETGQASWGDFSR
jgi:hypothetical protein